MKSTETFAKHKPTPAMGPAATLCRLFLVKGRRISKAGRVLSVAVVALLALLALASAPALADTGPESPVTVEPSEIKSTTAVLQGVVNPLGSAVVSWFFEYKAGPVCAGGSTTLVEGPAEVEAQPVAVGIEGLTKNTKYAVCLVAENDAKEQTVGNTIAFTTAIPPQAPETSSPPKSITASSAVLEGILNPSEEAEAGWYFLYSTEPTCAGGGSATPAVAVAKIKAKTGEHAALDELQPHKTYTFCLVATNSAGEALAGNEVPFETKAVAPAIESEATVVPVAAHEATFETTINPNNDATTYEVEYSTSATGETLNAPVTTVAGAGPLEGYPGQVASLATTAALVQNTTYYYRVRAENAKGEKATDGKVQHFTTAPETPEGEEANPIGTASATLDGVLSPNATDAGEAGSYEFRYRRSASECQGGESSEDEATPTTTAHGSAKESVSAAVTGLSPGTVYTFCLLERSAEGETAVGAPTTFMTDGAAIRGEQASTVEASAATLQASIDPNESETSYRFEYDTTPYTASARHGVSITEAGENEEMSIGSGTTPVPVSVRLQGLEPDTTYYYRLVATDTIETFDGPGKSFTTPSLPVSEPAQGCPNEQLRSEQPYGTTLPDCRAYELVSPSETNGGDAIDEAYLSRASVSGDAITFPTTGAAYADPSGAEFINQLLSVREPANDRWSTRSISPPYFAGAAGESGPYEAVAFTPELSRGVATTDVPLTGEVPAEGLFDMYVADFADDSYRWVSNAPKDGEPYQYNGLYQPLVMGTSTDLSHVVFKADGLYEWTNGEIRSIGVTNDGEGLSAGVGSGNGHYEDEADTWHAVSADGSRVIFTSPNNVEEPSRALYMRVNTEQEQSRLGAEGECVEPAKACTVALAAAARYWGASADGTKVFYTKGGDLYEYRLSLGQTIGQVTALTKGGAVQGVVQISENGAYVYFVADGDLGGEAKAGQPNLYVSHEGGAPAFIATLAESDTSDWSNQEYEIYYPASPTKNTAALTPGGTRLAFISSRSLTGYDNQQAGPAECERGLAYGSETGACREIFVYDAETGQLRCASCNPSGARPIGPSGFKMNEGGESYREYKPRNLAEDGTLYFQSYDALVPQDNNHRLDVYEYRDGHLHALSDVSGDSESAFVDASPSGNDVFIATADSLLPQAQGDRNAVYDVRVGGGFPASAVAPQCDSGDTCKPPPTPQPNVFATPASATFSGAGNTGGAGSNPTATVTPKRKTTARSKAEKLDKALKRCARDKQKGRRASCEKSARRQYETSKSGNTKKIKHAKKADADRRASR